MEKLKTLKLEINNENLQKAGKILAEGGLVAFPTETVYGLGADAMNAEAVGKVYEAKGRPCDNPMIVHIAEPEEILELTEVVTPTMHLLMEAFWPGPMTMVVPALGVIPSRTTGGLRTVGVRMPSDEVARKLIGMSGCLVAAPSANLSGKPSPTKAKYVVQDLDGRVDCILMGDDCQVGIESTVVDVTGEKPVILRPGIITPEEMEEVLAILGIKVVFDPALMVKDPENEEFKPKAPGMKYKHYAPKAEMHIVSGEKENVRKKIKELKEILEAEGKKVGVILFDEDSFNQAAHDFFSKLREFDDENTDVILAGALNLKDSIGFAIMNRMLKSAGYSVISV